jgi:hypothetical protein
MSIEKIKKVIFRGAKELNWKDFSILAVSLVLGIYLKWNIFEIAIFCVFIYIILHPVESRYLAMPALFFLVLTPFFLVFKQEAIAEQLAIYCYYFLIMTVMMGIYEVRKDDREINLK